MRLGIDGFIYFCLTRARTRKGQTERKEEKLARPSAVLLMVLSLSSLYKYIIGIIDNLFSSRRLPHYCLVEDSNLLLTIHVLLRGVGHFFKEAKASELLS